jgi:hypothetical protein
MVESRELVSNMTLARLWQFEKQPSQSVSTEAGIEIERSAVHSENADFPKIETRLSDSKITFDKCAQ